MLNNWLVRQQRTPSGFDKFDVVDIGELAPPTDAVKIWLKDLLIDARVGSDFLESARNVLGSRMKLLLEAALPNMLTIKRGDFGEALVDAVCQEWHGYEIPVKKLRFALGGSPRGTDNLAIRLNANLEIVEVCYIESKLRSTTDNNAAKEAHAQLDKLLQTEMPIIHEFVLRVLYDQRSELFEPYLNYLKSRSETGGAQESFWIFLTYEKNRWSEVGLTNLEAEDIEVAPLSVKATRIENLVSLIDGLYNAIGFEADQYDE